MLNEWVRLFLAILAVYRLAQLFAWDYGPFDIFARLRLYAGRRANGSRFWHSFADLIHCPYCSAVWFGALVVPSLLMPSLLGDIVIIALGLAGAQVLLQDRSKPRAAGED